MGQALYRKYRPRSLKEVAGQEHITQTLQQALDKGQISHAYLFTGPRGVGKTSIARILAHEINGLKYTDDSTHIDIIEIDAASNRRIDEIRELRDKVYVSPTESKYKVYIIDEVHMLTKEAFNALLKTLEEPPAHVVFILATTDAHKLPETIISRTQRYSFKPIKPKDIEKQLGQIAKDEKVKISPEALSLIAEHGQGSLRDSISLLDQARSQDKEIDAESIIHILGLPPKESILSLLDGVMNSSDSTSEFIGKLNTLYEQGYPAAIISKQLSQILRQKLINNDNDIDEEATLDILSDLIDVPASLEPERYLEITLLKAKPKDAIKPIRISEPVPIEEPVYNEPPQEVEETLEVPETAVPIHEAEEEKVVETKAKSVPKIDLDLSMWSQVLDALKKKHNTVYSVVRMASPSFDEEGNLDLAFAFSLHQKKINEAGNKQLLHEVIHELTGKNIQIECHLDKNARPPKLEKPKIEPAAAPKSNDIDNISSIFKGAEVLES